MSRMLAAAVDLIGADFARPAALALARAAGFSDLLIFSLDLETGSMVPVGLEAPLLHRRQWAPAVVSSAGDTLVDFPSYPDGVVRPARIVRSASAAFALFGDHTADAPAAELLDVFRLLAAHLDSRMKLSVEKNRAAAADRARDDAEKNAAALVSVQHRLDRANFEKRQLLRELERRVELRTRDLSNTSRVLEATVYALAHQLRSPVRQIDAAAYMLSRDSGEREDLLARVRGAAGKMGALIDGLVMIADLGSHVGKKSEVDLSALAASVAQAFEPSPKTRIRVQPGLRAQGFEDMLKLLLSHLIENALRHSRSSAEPTIEIASDGENSFFVRDNGEGIDSGFAEEILKPFHKLDSSPRLGLGLAICDRVVRLHGGRLWIESAVGRGTTIHFSLPRSAGAEVLSEPVMRRLKAEGDLLELVVEQAPVAMGVLEGPEFAILLYNRAAESLAGVPAGQARGRPVLEAFPAVRELLPLLKRAYEGERVEFTATVDLPSGKRLLDASYQPLPATADGVRRILYTAVDRTAAAAAAAELAESEQRLRLLADIIPQLVWMADAEGSIFWYNRRWFEYTGTTIEQMRGWGWTSVHDPEMLPRVMERWKRSIATGQPFEMEFPLRGADGKFRWFLTRVEPLKDGHGKIVRWFGTNTDVDATVALVEARTRELRASVQEYETFAYSVAHDLRAPLRSIRSLSELLAQRFQASLPEQARGLLARIVLSADRMDRMVRDLLEYSKIGRTPFQLLPVDLESVVSAVLDAHEHDLKAKKVRITVSRPLRAVIGDRTLLEQAVGNLVANAIKFVAPDRPPEITIGCHQRGDLVRLEIADNGIGIAPESQEEIFKVFHRLHAQEAYEGSGIGLAIVKRVAERLGGQVGVASQPGQGSVFWLALPAAATKAR